MEHRVYINPNFKRTETDFWPPEQIKTTHFNRHFVEDMPNRVTHAKTNETILNNRKIYVNPNFINRNNTTPNQPRSIGYIETNKNVNCAINAQLKQNTEHTVQNFQQSIINKVQVNNIMQINKSNVQASRKDVTPCFTNAKTPNIPVVGTTYIENMNIVNRQLIHKSKYSLVQNFPQTVNDRENSLVSSKGSNEITKKTMQEIPLAKSRYCIIRKKRRLSLTVEQKNAMKLNNHFVTPVPIASSNQLKCYTNIHAMKNNEKYKYNCKTPEKITKIKITKYKIVPVNSLKKISVVQNNENKSVALTHIKSNTRLSSSLVASNHNRFKFVKSRTPMKLSTIIKSSTSVSTNKTASRSVQHIRKGACSGVKVKSLKTLRAKFNVNNIPCRLFTKYGKCLRQDQGNCKYLHDKKHVSLCRKFLKGICHDESCSLSHELTAKKMPTCYFYLNGMCTKDGCPYLHVKLSDKTKICQEFAKGYCESGDKCPYKHVNNNQKKIKMLSYKSQRSSQRKSTNIKIEKENTENYKTVDSEEKLEKYDGDCRYYKESVKEDESYDAIKPKRCKLGMLPSFIQL